MNAYLKNQPIRELYCLQFNNKKEQKVQL